MAGSGGCCGIVIRGGCAGGGVWSSGTVADLPAIPALRYRMTRVAALARGFEFRVAASKGLRPKTASHLTDSSQSAME